MEKKIKKDWGLRFRQMMEDHNWTYKDVAKIGSFKNGKVIEATISRGVPAFAKLAVMIHELNKNKPFHQLSNWFIAPIIQAHTKKTTFPIL